MQIRMLREIDDMFEGVPQTRKTLEAKEEMLQNLMEKYNDLLAEGKSEEAAFQIALDSVGDISDLIAELQQPIPQAAHFPEPDLSDYEDEPSPPHQQTPEEVKHHRARMASVAVMLYILSPLAIILFGGKIGLVLLFVMIAAATGLLIYNGMVGKDKPPLFDEPQEDQPQKPKKMTDQQRKLFSSLSSALWMITVALYFVISFSTGAWHITWIIFLIASALNSVFKAFIDLYRA